MSASRWIKARKRNSMVSVKTRKKSVADVPQVSRAKSVDMPCEAAVFGTPLGVLMSDNDRCRNGIPNIMYDCLAYIEVQVESDVDHVGIFRVPGNHNEVMSLKEAYNKGNAYPLNECDDVHTTASLLKMFLRELPEPLIPEADFKALAEILESNKQSKMEVMKSVRTHLEGLTKTNYDCIRAIFSLVNIISSKSDINQMTPNNLAIVLGPAMMRKEEQSLCAMTSIVDSSLATRCAEFIIAHHVMLFPAEAPAESPRNPGKLSRGRSRSGSLTSLSFRSFRKIGN